MNKTLMFDATRYPELSKLYCERIYVKMYFKRRGFMQKMEKRLEKAGIQSISQSFTYYKNNPAFDVHARVDLMFLYSN